MTLDALDPWEEGEVLRRTKDVAWPRITADESVL